MAPIVENHAERRGIVCLAKETGITFFAVAAVWVGMPSDTDSPICGLRSLPFHWHFGSLTHRSRFFRNSTPMCLSTETTTNDDDLMPNSHRLGETIKTSKMPCGHQGRRFLSVASKYRYEEPGSHNCWTDGRCKSKCRLVVAKSHLSVVLHNR